MSDLDVTRARAILEKAVELGMYEVGAIPEADAMLLSEAENMVLLCRQAEELKNAIGAEKMPLWPKVEAILNVAQGSAAEAVVPPQGSAEPPAVQQEPLMPVADPPTKIVPVVTQIFKQDETRADPQNGEVWEDQSGAAWQVVSYSGGQTAEATLLSTGETTIVPAGMLKRRVQQQQSSVLAEPGPAEEQIRAREETPDGPVDQPPVAEVAVDPDPPLPYVSQEKPPEPVPAPPIASQQEPAPVEPPLPDICAERTKRAEDVPDDEGDEAYARLLDETARRFTPTGMPVPVELSGPPTISVDGFNEVDDLTARALHSQFNALAALARYRMDVARARERACSMMLKLTLKGPMRAARDFLPSSATLTEVRDLADGDEIVQVWMSRRDKHFEEAEAYKTFFSIYTEHVVVLSRDWTMRATQERGS